jgi:hypothetical protein
MGIFNFFTSNIKISININDSNLFRDVNLFIWVEIPTFLFYKPHPHIFSFDGGDPRAFSHDKNVWELERDVDIHWKNYIYIYIYIIESLIIPTLNFL